MLSPSQRFYLAILLAFVFSVISHLSVALLLFLPFVTYFLVQKYKHRQFLSAVKFLALFNIFSLLLWLSMRYQWQDGWHYSPEREQLAFLLIAKMNLITLAIRILLQELSELQLIQILQHRFIPAKFAHLALLTLRYIKIFSETHRTLERAMQARGFQAGCNKRTLYVISQRVTLLLIHALYKAEQLDRALRARGFCYDNPKRPRHD
ncbi:energy-coupling factor transporter transmembrane component T family protein [Pasteurella sp. PK-2025]|uniref:energy-coupling factor transporter transmembrane component T family protein n=1 Tax=unclassified Pasteurella TaxID=2621516 RepID=UPI003C7470B9